MSNLINTNQTLICERLADLPVVAKQIIERAGQQVIWIFDGQMGAGKTTLIRTIGHILSIEDEVSSPTFSLVNEYQNDRKEVFYHFDFYRITTQQEALDIGVEEYFYSGNICFIEWAAKIPDLLPSEYFKITIEVISETSRKFQLTYHD